MTTTEHTLMDYLEEAHGALVSAAKEAHLTNHSQAEAISELIDALEEIVSKIVPNTALENDEDQQKFYKKDNL